MRSSNCFNDASGVTVSFIERQLLFCDRSRQQSHQRGLRFLLGRKNATKGFLCIAQSSLLDFLRRFIFIQGILDLCRRRVIVNGVLQCLLFYAGILSAEATTATAATTTEQGTHIGSSNSRPRINHFLNQRLYRSPIGVIREIQHGTDVIHNALLHLSGIEISAPTAAKTSSSSPAISAATTIATTTAILRQKRASAQTERGSHRAHS